MEPVVAHPPVDHRIHRNRDFERRMRIDQAHQWLESVVGNPQLSHLAIRLGGVLDEPVDRVPGVGRLVDLGVIERADERAIHDVIALGAVLAADILHHADVAAGNNDVLRIVVPVQFRAKVRALGICRRGARVVRRARHEDRRVAGAFGNKDHRVQLDAVPHRDHHVAPRVVPGGVHTIEPGRRFVAGRRVLGLDGCGVEWRQEYRDHERGAARERMAHRMAPLSQLDRTSVTYCGV